MAWLKGQEIGGYVNIAKKVKFTDSVIASKMNDLPWSTVRYVDGINGSDSNDGLSPTKAFLTIQAAVTASSYQDVIYVRPLAPSADASDPNAYTEQVTVALAKHNLSIIGVTSHSIDPYYGVKQYVPDTVSYWGFRVNAPGFHLENFCIENRDVTATPAGAIFLEGAQTGGVWTKAGSIGSSIVNCQLWPGQLRIDGGYDCTAYGVIFNNMVHDNTLGYNFSCPSTGGINPQWGMRVENCRFLAKHAAAPTNHYMYIQGSGWGWSISHCYYDKIPASGNYIYLNGVVDGLISDCYFNSANVTVASGLSLGSGFIYLAGCYDQLGLIAS